MRVEEDDFCFRKGDLPTVCLPIAVRVGFVLNNMVLEQVSAPKDFGCSLSVLIPQLLHIYPHLFTIVVV